MEEVEPREEQVQPNPNVPVDVKYCPSDLHLVCTFPVEYCEYGPTFDQCKKWIAVNCPEVYPELAEELQKCPSLRLTTEETKAPTEEVKETAPVPVSKKASKKPPARITISVNKKNFNRSVTIVSGLETFSRR